MAEKLSNIDALRLGLTAINVLIPLVRSLLEKARENGEITEEEYQERKRANRGVFNADHWQVQPDPE